MKDSRRKDEIMLTRSATARWDGSLKDGKGNLELGSAAWSGPYSFRTRFEDERGTNPEELIGAAHAGCFSMALAAALGKAGHTPKHIETVAHVRLVKDEKSGGFAIDRVHLTTQASVPEIDEGEFEKLAGQAKETCPVSKALAGTTITLEHTLRR
jgi:osmotically inducible protein OsmC